MGGVNELLYHEKIGNLFDVSQDYALVHCISEDCALGAGIALEFTKRYPEMKKQLLLQKREITDIIFYQSKNKHFVFNLITKERYYHKPKREDFNSAILNLKKRSH